MEALREYAHFMESGGVSPFEVMREEGMVQCEYFGYCQWVGNCIGYPKLSSQNKLLYAKIRARGGSV